MKIRIKFSKQGNMRFIGHLDIMRYFQKVMRRADVNIRYSEGFSPHQIMSFAAPLGVGLTGSGEYLDIEVLSTDSSAEMLRRMNATMAEGMEIISYKKLPD
ncbi:MAG: TIGR03936 family radical SAM-associated protein, partial [Lachnospiraceae bacterium]|nr:TIGR03936 family radical SAM-associated protein [Lachnospiraceae bacterium]